MVGNLNDTLKLIWRVLRWILRDPLRPKFKNTWHILAYFIIAPFFSTAAFLLLSMAVIQAPLPRWLDSRLSEILPDNLSSADLYSNILLWSPALVALIYLSFAGLSYLAQRRLLRASMAYQHQLANRAVDYYYATLNGRGQNTIVDVAAIRKLIMGDSRYLARIYLSILSLVPQLIMSILSLVMLVFVVPMITLSMLGILAVFLPLYIYVASKGQRASQGFLDGAGKLSRYLPLIFRRFATYPCPNIVSSDNFRATVLNEQSEDFFVNFEERTRMTYLGGFVSSLALTCMLAVLIFQVPDMGQGDITSKVGVGVILLIAARYFFQGVRALLSVFVGIGNTYPYYATYMTVFPDSRWELSIAEVPLETVPENNFYPTLLESHGGVILPDLHLRADNVLRQLSRSLKTEIVNPLLQKDAENIYSNGEPEDALPRSLIALDTDDSYTPATLLLRGLIKAILSGVETLGIWEEDWRKVNESRRKNVIIILQNANIATLILNRSADKFCLPRPTQYWAYSPARHSLFDISEADSVPLHLKKTRVKPLDKDQVSKAPVRTATAKYDICLPVSSTAYKAYRTVLSNCQSATVFPLNVDTARTQKLAFDFNGLHTAYPTLSGVWMRAYSILNQSYYVEAPSPILAKIKNSIVLGLTLALQQKPNILIFPHDILKQIRQSDRKALFKVLHEANIQVATRRRPEESTLLPLAENSLYIDPDGLDMSIISYAVRVVGSPIESLEVDVKGIRRIVKEGETLGLVGNHRGMNWHILNLLETVIGEDVPRLFEHVSILAPNLFLEEFDSDLFNDIVKQIDLEKLGALYADLSHKWGEVMAIMKSARASGTRALSANQAFYMALAAALTHETKTLFIDEDDFRLIPQAERVQVVKSLNPCLVVVWKNQMRLPFIKPQPSTGLMVDLSGIIGEFAGHETARDISARHYKRLICQPFRPPSFEQSDLLMEE